MKAGAASHLLVGLAVLISVGAFVRPWIWPNQGFAVEAANLRQPFQSEALGAPSEPTAGHDAMPTRSRVPKRSGPLPVDWFQPEGDPTSTERTTGSLEPNAANRAAGGTGNAAAGGNGNAAAGGNENVAPSRERPDQGHVPPRDA